MNEIRTWFNLTRFGSFRYCYFSRSAWSVSLISEILDDRFKFLVEKSDSIPFSSCSFSLPLIYIFSFVAVNPKTVWHPPSSDQLVTPPKQLGNLTSLSPSLCMSDIATVAQKEEIKENKQRATIIMNRPSSSRLCQDLNKIIKSLMNGTQYLNSLIERIVSSSTQERVQPQLENSDLHFDKRLI
jgi:hypothetical protein